MIELTKGRRAVVLGGGIAGLSAAGVLARHFEHVLLVERDAYPDQPAVRPHAPQGAHVHVLLAKGLEILGRLVPDLGGWLDEMGLHEGDLTHHVRTAYAGNWLPKVRSGVPFRPCSRPEVEHLLRRDVRRRPNIEVLDDQKALGLLGERRVRGVRVSAGGAERDIDADLVVDAMGRASPSMRWLREKGAAPVREETVDAGVVYTSCLFEPRAPIDDDWMMMGVSAEVPHQPKLGALMRLGEGRVLAAYVGYGKPRPPRTVDELVAATAHLSVPELHLLLRASRPASDVAVFGNTSNRFRHYGALPSFPDGVVSIGDAVCTLNPRYGQGMTVASLSADLLDGELTAHHRERGGLDGFSLRYQKSLERALQVPWQMALMEDRLWVSTFSGEPPGLAERLLMSASARMVRAVFSDVEMFIRFIRVAHLLDSPARMLHPRVLAALARGRGEGVERGEPPRCGSD